MKVLIAEDEAAVADSMEFLLGPVADPSEIQKVGSLDGLLNYIQYDPEVIITDIYMPGTGALELRNALPLIRVMCPNTVIVIVSGILPDGETARLLIEAGADMFAEKSDVIRHSKLLEIVAMAYEKRKGSTTDERFWASLDKLRRVASVKRSSNEELES